MKNILCSILSLLLITSFTIAFSQTNDSLQHFQHSNGYKISYIGNNLIKDEPTIIKIKPDLQNEKFNVVFGDGKIEKINQYTYKITPEKAGYVRLKIKNSEFLLVCFQAEKPAIFFDNDVRRWHGIISKEALLNSTNFLVERNSKKYELVSFTTTIQSSHMVLSLQIDDPQMFFDFKDQFSLMEQGDKIELFNILIKDKENKFKYIDNITYTIVDSYENEFIRKVVKLHPNLNDLNLLKTNLRIKISGNPSKSDLSTLNNLVNDLNESLETTEIELVKNRSNLVITFMDEISENIKNNSEFKKVNSGYLIQRRNIFFPFYKTFKLFVNKNIDNKDRQIMLQKDILNMLCNFTDVPINLGKDSSIFNQNPKLSMLDKKMLKTVYSKNGERNIIALLNIKTEESKTDLIIILFILSIFIWFVFTEIYQYYGFNNKINNLKSKFLATIIESFLYSQIPVIAILIILLINGIEKNNFHEMPFAFIVELFFVPFSILTGIFFSLSDMILRKLQRKWISAFSNLILTTLSIFSSYQIIYFIFFEFSFIKISNLEWEIWILPISMISYRLYSRYTNQRISTIIHEKELEIIKEKELKIKSELNALQAKINPHFLYNSLNSIAALSQTSPSKTEQMAISLSKLFRYNLNKDEDYYTCFSEEIEMCKIYLEIEKIRFGERLDYSVEIEKELENYKIPKFLLQPLIENAIKHGITKITSKGYIKLNIKKQENSILIEILDNGHPFTNDMMSGYGLQSTYDKLKILYKKPFSIEFINTPQKKLLLILNSI